MWHLKYIRQNLSTIMNVFICNTGHVPYMHIVESYDIVDKSLNLLYNLGTSSGLDGILIGTLTPPILMESPPITTTTLDLLYLIVITFKMVLLWLKMKKVVI